jgi:hypothetical protein
LVQKVLVCESKQIERELKQELLVAPPPPPEPEPEPEPEPRLVLEPPRGWSLARRPRQPGPVAAPGPLPPNRPFLPPNRLSLRPVWSG